MSRKKVVALDIDNVVIDFSARIQEYLAKQGITFKPEKVERYDFTGEIGCSKEDVYNSFHNVDFYDDLPYTEGAKEAIQKLKDNNIEVVGYTGAVNVSEIVESRSKLLRDLGLSGSVYIGEKPVLNDFDALFEDSLEVIVRWQKAKSKTKLYLINKPYNQVSFNEHIGIDWSKLQRVDNLLSAVDNFLEKGK